MPREDFKPKKSGGGNMLLSPATLAKIQEGLAKLDIILDPVQFESIERGGSKYYRLRPQPFPEQRPGGGGQGEQGAFFTLYQDDAGDTKLQGGTVTGGNGGSDTVADYKVLDPDTGVGTLADQILYLQVACEATVEDGLMMPGCTITTATLEHAATVPDNHTFTVASPTGNLYLEVGRWTATDFLPAGPPGNILASGCIGNFSLSKVT